MREFSREFADMVESFRDNESACCTTDNGFSATLKMIMAIIVLLYFQNVVEGEWTSKRGERKRDGKKSAMRTKKENLKQHS